jgi:putative membrane protein
MSTKLLRDITLGALLAGAWTIAPAQNTQSPQGTTRTEPAGKSSNALDSKDQRYVKKAAEGGMTEVELGRLAQSKASNEEVKQFGARMEKDHGKANDELKRIAEAKGIAVAALPDRAENGRIEKLKQAAEGADFDKKYMADMVKDHEKDLKLFREAARNAKDPEIKSFFQETAQTIKEHLAMARKVADDVGATSAQSARNRAEADSHAYNAEDEGNDKANSK